MFYVTCILARDADCDERILERVESGVQILDQAIVESDEICALIKYFIFCVYQEIISQLMP